MIYSVRGKVAAMEPGLAVIECAGVGYACRTSTNTLSQIRDKNEVFLYTYLHITENAVDLFGFADSSELSCFKQLISVSGVGPKAALSILSDFTPSKVALCIATGDSKTLTKSPGIGTKIAQKIVFELKDKIAKEQHFSSAELQSLPQSGGNNVTEAMEALAVLGFAPAQINSALMGADPSASVEELIKFGLKNLASG
ncbi:MAG: Holliday junction branch migration protein RuvA [Oscillospiraceae bacterium]|nr:Holliday junction branch migration protein RuvA [Oscillospiraceae bacterium]